MASASTSPACAMLVMGQATTSAVKAAKSQPESVVVLWFMLQDSLSGGSASVVARGACRSSAANAGPVSGRAWLIDPGVSDFRGAPISGSTRLVFPGVVLSFCANVPCRAGLISSGVFDSFRLSVPRGAGLVDSGVPSDGRACVSDCTRLVDAPIARVKRSGHCGSARTYDQRVDPSLLHSRFLHFVFRCVVPVA